MADKIAEKSQIIY